MKKIIAVAAMAIFCGSATFAQISDAQVTSRTINVGNRPQQGSFGIYMGATTNMFNDLFDGNTEFKSLPLVNLKYMVTDRVEARLGLQFYKKSESIKATEVEALHSDEYKFKWMTTQNRLYPGVAYHFSPRNILDVYAGAELLIGWERQNNQTLLEDYNIDGPGSMSAFQFGGGAFIGLQAFIGDLPLAVGLEYGFHGYGNYGQKFKAVTEDGDYYTVNADAFEHIGEAAGLSGDKMGARKTQFGQQVRLTFSYYFNR